MSVIKKYSFNGYTINTETYSNASEIIVDVKKRPITDTMFMNMQKEDLSKDVSRYGVKSYEEALKLLEFGYQPIVDKLKMQIKANVKGTDKRISFHNDIVGYAPIVPLAILGVPNSMINSYMKPIKSKVIDVYIDITYSWVDSNERIIKSSSRILSVILKLEQQGYRFNIYCVKSQSDSNDCDMMIVKIKDALQPIDLKRISFPLAHTAFSRVIGWDWYSKFPKGKYRSGYGHSITFESKFKDEWVKKMFGNNAIMLSAKKLLDEDEKYLAEVLINASVKN